MKAYLLKIQLIALVFTGFYCSEQVELSVGMGYDFFPLAVGQSRTYLVEEVIITGSVPDTSNYFLQEVIADSIQNGSQTTYVIYRYIAEDSTIEWSLDSVWTARRTDHQAVVIENNIPFVKLTFPVKENTSWDGNALNSFDASTYYFEKLENFQLKEFEFDLSDLIRVIIADVPANLVEQDERSETYARGIGLVQKAYISGSFCQPGSGCEEVGIIDEGRVLFQSLISYEEE